MNRVRALWLALTAVASVPSQAAEITRIASSGEDKKPFGMFIDLGFDAIAERARISREVRRSGGVEESDELRYSRTDFQVRIDAHIGLWRDLELHYGVPFVIKQARSWNFASGVDASTSSITNNCLRADGTLLNPNCLATGLGRQSIFDVPNSSNRSGLGNMTFGLAWGIFNQRKDDTKPDWILGFDYTAPTADRLDPTASDKRLGDRLHKFTAFTALAKQLGAVEPYFKAQVTVPYRGPGWYSNCDNASSSNMGHPENCGVSPWTRQETGIRGPTVVTSMFGAEFNMFQEPAADQKAAIDLRLIGTYVSNGRYYNEMSDLLRKLLFTQEYLEAGALVSLLFHFGPNARLILSGNFTYRTEHFLTSETIGRDLDGDGAVDISRTPVEINPNFDWRTDLVSQRFRLTHNLVYSGNATFVIAF